MTAAELDQRDILYGSAFTPGGSSETHGSSLPTQLQALLDIRETYIRSIAHPGLLYVHGIVSFWPCFQVGPKHMQRSKSKSARISLIYHYWRSAPGFLSGCMHQVLAPRPERTP